MLYQRADRNYPLPSTREAQVRMHRAPQTLSEALKLYEMTYMPSRNFSGKTRTNYGGDLADLVRFLKQNTKEHLTDISLRDLEAYLADLDRRGYAGT